MAHFVNVAGAWKTIASLFPRVSGAYKAARLWVNVGGAWKSVTPASLIDRTAGSNIGNMTSGGGLAAAFDGVTNSAGNVGAQKAAAAANVAYIGKTTAAPTAVESVTCFGANNDGYVNNTNPSVTIQLYGKSGAAPGSPTDGTLLGSITFTDTTNESAGRQIVSSNISTYWDHVWIRISQPDSFVLNVAELQITGWQ